ncbi:translocation/assembly module TamB domain-containing protein [Pacificoceanicola onchidii]|uniref:translocation/assembly module TamB domain-containing protein n=1 Tax=Pacificoceanicola onchidii TaxID=2562685 RepID=UPI0010A3467D|nr:translocation/assembly module TamB domain-containing protein [Pacificoceanicola onchidii]
MRWFLVPIVILFQMVASMGHAQEDKDRLTRFLEETLSGAGRQVTVEGFRGALSSRATMDRLLISDDDGVWLELTDAVLDWNRAAIFGGRIEINELTAASIRLTRLPASESQTSPEATPFALPELPVSVDIGKIEAARVEIGAPVAGVALIASINGSLRLEGGEGAAKLDISRLDGPQGAFDLAVSYGNASEVLVVDVTVSEGPGGIVATQLGLPGAPALELTASGNAPIDDFTAEVHLRSNGQDRLSGQVETVAGGDDSAPRILQVDLSGDLAPLFVPQYQDFFGPNVALNARVSLYPEGRVVLDDLTASAAALRLNGSFALGADGLPKRFQLDGVLRDPGGAPVLLPIPGPQTRVDSAQITAGFDAEAGQQWRLSGDLLGLRRDDLALGALQLTGGGVIVPGNTPRVTARIDASAKGIDPANPGLREALGDAAKFGADIAWQSGAPIRFGDLELSAEGMSLTGAGTFDAAAGEPVLKGTLDADVANLSRLSTLVGQDLAGQADMAVSGQVFPLSGGFDLDLVATGEALSVSIKGLDDVLRGQSRIALSVLRDTNGLTVRSATVQGNGVGLQGQGVLTSEGTSQRFTGTLDAQLASLSPFSHLAGRSLGGALDARLNGFALLDGSQFDFDLKADAQSLGVGIPDVNALLTGPSTLDLSAKRQDGAITLRRASLDASGGSLSGTGTLKGADGTLDFNARLANLGRYVPALAGAAAASGRAVLQNGDLTVTLDANGPRATQVKADVALPNGGSPSARFDARIGSLAWLAPELAGPATASGTARQSGGDWVLDINATGAGTLRAAVTGRVAPDAGSANLAINGALPLALLNARISPNALQGMADFNLGLNGPLALSSLSGEITTTAARLAVPSLRNALKKISATVRLGGGTASFETRGRLDSGGKVGVQGRVRMAAPFVTEAVVALDDLKITDPELYEARASGQLRLSGTAPSNLALTGNLNLDQTELRVPSTGISSFGDIPAITHIGEPSAVRQTRSYAGLLDVTGAGRTGGSGALSLDLQINALNKIFVRGRGLDAELGGSLRLTGTSADVIPEGRFDLIRGRLDILGKRLTLEEGDIRLQGDLIPNLRLVAQTSAEDTTVFITVEGPADAPQITFTSDPALPEDEVLARLLFGKDIRSISALQAVQLASAVATLAGKGGVGIIENLRRSTGFDDLDVTSDENGGATVRAGKYISDNAYTNVEIDSQGETSINLNLDLTNSTTVRGRVGSDGSTGIGLFFERDY